MCENESEGRERVSRGGRVVSPSRSLSLPVCLRSLRPLLTSKVVNPLVFGRLRAYCVVLCTLHRTNRYVPPTSQPTSKSTSALRPPIQTLHTASYTVIELLVQYMARYLSQHCPLHCAVSTLAWPMEGQPLLLGLVGRRDRDRDSELLNDWTAYSQYYESPAPEGNNSIG